jgi:hypothetical protein
MHGHEDGEDNQEGSELSGFVAAVGSHLAGQLALPPTVNFLRGSL